MGRGTHRRSRRLIHCNVTAHPSAAWTLQQLREVVGYEDRYKFLIHDRDDIFASQLDESIQALGIRVLKSAPHSPKMNAICERVIGTIRRECLDWLIPLSAANQSLVGCIMNTRSEYSLAAAFA
jgi:putative transposase